MQEASLFIVKLLTATITVQTIPKTTAKLLDASVETPIPILTLHTITCFTAKDHPTEHF